MDDRRAALALLWAQCLTAAVTYGLARDEGEDDILTLADEWFDQALSAADEEIEGQRVAAEEEIQGQTGP